MSAKHCLAAIAVLFVAGACQAEDVPAPVVSSLKPASIAGEGINAKIAVKPLSVDMLEGDTLGHVSLGIFCINQQTRNATKEFINAHGGFAASVMNQELKRLGYNLVNLGRSNAFDTNLNDAPDFRVGGIIRSVKFETCATGPSAKGWVYYKIDWAVYSEKEQKVILERKTEGVSKSEDRTPDLMKLGLVAAIDNFLADPAFAALLKQPPTTPTASAPSASTSSTLAIRVKDLKAIEPVTGGVKKNQAQLIEAVVTLETATGTGSGFFIHKDGYLLTDYHVIAGARYAKLKLPNGDKLVAEVVKVNEHDDVALLKSAPIEFAPLSIRFDAAEVGEPVYAIGSPLGVLTSTVTKGILSADRFIQGSHFLQSDAAITFGNSGGPLLDADGRIIGLTKATLNAAQGFNLFIPILDALKALDITEY